MSQSERRLPAVQILLDAGRTPVLVTPGLEDLRDARSGPLAQARQETAGQSESWRPPSSNRSVKLPGAIRSRGVVRSLPLVTSPVGG